MRHLRSAVLQHTNFLANKKLALRHVPADHSTRSATHTALCTASSQQASTINACLAQAAERAWTDGQAGGDLSNFSLLCSQPSLQYNGLGMTSVHIYSSRWESSTPNHSPSTKHRKPPRMKSFLSLLAILPLALAKPTVYLIRHGEKPSSGNGLSTQGMQRAQCLRNVFGASSSYNIEYILTQDYKKGKKSPTIPFVTPTGTNIVTPW